MRVRVRSDLFCKYVERVWLNDPEQGNCVDWCLKTLDKDKFSVHVDWDETSQKWFVVFGFAEEIDQLMFILSLRYASVDDIINEK